MNVPHTSEGPGATGPDAKLSNNKSDFATDHRHRKAIATLIAKLAIWGHAVHKLADGGFLVCKYGYTHHATDLEGLRAFAVRLGVPNA